MAAEKSSEGNMPCWYYEKSDLKKTPSFYDGISSETEARYRREGPRFIFDMGTRLGLHHDTIATAIVFFHRFYMFHSFKKFPRHVTATCCLFLAGKVEETPKKCKDLIKVAKSLLNEAQFAQFADDPKEEVLTFEKVLLQTIKFDLTVEHPYKYMLQYAKGLKGERSKIENLVQMSWTFINDSLCTSLCLQWEPQIVAVAVMYLAGRLCKFEPQDWAYNRGRWWEQFISDISMDLLEDICHQVLDQYSHAKGGKGGSNKAKRERPKTPGDADKSGEPQVKSSKNDSQKSAQKTKSSQKPHATRQNSTSSGKNQSSIQRRGSSNTEVVAMDTVDTTDSGAIEQGNPAATKATATAQGSTPATSKEQTPTKSQTSEQQSTYYGDINQYQSFLNSTDQNSLAFLQQQQGQYYQQFQQNFNNISVTPPPVRPTYSGASTSGNAASYPGYPPMPGSYEGSFHGTRFPQTPPSDNRHFSSGQSSFSSSFGSQSGQSSTGLATVRITGRRDKPGNTKWS